jgi:hypothetical protein
MQFMELEPEHTRMRYHELSFLWAMQGCFSFDLKNFGPEHLTMGTPWHHVETFLQWRTGLRKYHQPSAPPSIDAALCEY